MTTATDWLKNVEEELQSGFITAPEADYVMSVIRKHCPFKQDVAYRKVTAEDYPRDHRHNDDID